MSCGYADWDGSYVLGALSPSERLEFEQHLAACPDCARSVRELAGLPGLLSQVDPTVLETPTSDVPVPATLLPALVREVRRSGRRRTLTTAGLAAAAVLVAAVPVAIGVRHGGSSPRATTSVGSTAAPTGRPMLVLGRAPVRADLALERVAWGTRLYLTCTYAPTPEQYELPSSVTYALLVRTRDGRTEQVGTWRSQEGRTMRLVAATAASRGDIASVQVRAPDGRTVLELTA